MNDIPRVVRFDHTILAAHDRHESARFFTALFGLPEPVEAGPFLAAQLPDGSTIDFAETTADFPAQHVAFLVDDDTFDAVVNRIHQQGIDHWADPQQRRPGEINTNHGGRGVYVDDPSGHHLEAMTVRYDGTRWYEA